MERMSRVVLSMVFGVVWFGGLLPVTIGVGTLYLHQIQPDGNPVTGDSVQLSCGATDLESGYVMEWARLVHNAMGEETLSNYWLSQNPRFTVSLQSMDSTSREEILIINDADSEDSGSYLCRVRGTNSEVLRAMSYSLTFTPPSTTLIPTSTKQTTVPLATCEDGPRLTPWIASTAALAGLLLSSVILNIYCILQHRKRRAKDGTPPDRAEPYTGLQPSGEQRSEYMGLATSGTSAVPPTGEAVQPVYYLALSEGNGGLEYDYPRPDDAANPVHGSNGVVRYMNHALNN